MGRVLESFWSVKNPGWRWRALLQACACALAFAGCAPVKQAAGEASQAAVHEGAEELTQEDTQQELMKSASDEDVQKAAQLMTKQIAEGVLDSLSSERAHEQIGALTQEIARNAALQLTQALTGPQVRQRVLGLTQEMTGAALQQVTASLQSDLRPALTEMLAGDLAQALDTAVRQQLQPAVGTTAHTMAYQAVLGANDGLGEVLAHPSGGILSARGFWSTDWMWWAVIVLGLIALTVVAAAVWMLARASRTRAEVSRLESATLLLATAMRERQQTTEQRDEMLALVQQALHGPAERRRKYRLLDALRTHRN